MMATELIKTSIVPPQNLDSLLAKFAIKMVVLVNDEDLVQKADNLAQDAPASVDRMVILILNPDFGELQTRFSGLQAANTIKAFALSTKNLVADVIRTGDKTDYVRIAQAFNNAGLPQFNASAPPLPKT